MEWLLSHQKMCPCGENHVLTDVHHVFIRRVKKNMNELYHPANCVAANNACHLAEGHDFQVASALICFDHVGGPDNVRKWVETLPLKIKHLPNHFVEAETIWNDRKKT